jgi:hypothetical protein
MSTNTLGTSNGSLIALRALQTLLEEFPWIRKISTDFSNEESLFNQDIKVVLPTALSSQTYSRATGYASQVLNCTEVTLTIDKHPHVTYDLDETERSSTDVNLIERWAQNAAHAIGFAMVSDLCAAITASAFTNASPIVPGLFSRNHILALNKKLNLRKLPGMGRFMILNSDYYATLCEDSSLVANPGSPSDTVKSGKINRVHGFTIDEYAQLADNSEDLGGFCGVPEGLLLATRLPQIPETEIPGSIEIITEPNSGLSIQMRSFYDMRAGLEVRTYTLMYGVAVGNAACLERITIAAP